MWSNHAVATNNHIEIELCDYVCYLHFVYHQTFLLEMLCVLLYRAPSIVLISNSLSCTDLARPGIRAVTNGEMLTFELCILHPITRPDGQNNNITQYKHAIKVVVIELCLLFRDYHFHSNSRGTLATSCSRPICHLFSLWCCPGCHSGSTTKPPVPGWL